MTQDERWIAQWQEIIDFMAENQRRPSKFVDSERGMRNWWKHQQKLMNAGELKAERVVLFNQLLKLGEQYKLHIGRFYLIVCGKICVSRFYILYLPR